MKNLRAETIRNFMIVNSSVSRFPSQEGIFVSDARTNRNHYYQSAPGIKPRDEFEIYLLKKIGPESFNQYRKEEMDEPLSQQVSCIRAEYHIPRRNKYIGYSSSVEFIS